MKKQTTKATYCNCLVRVWPGAAINSLNRISFSKIRVIKEAQKLFFFLGSKYSFTDKVLLREIMAVMVVMNIPNGKAQRLDLIEEVIQRDMLHKARGNLMSIIF